MPSENYKEKVASRDYSDSAMEERKKRIDAERAARLGMRASPELRWESLLGASHPAVAGHSVSSVPSTAPNDLESVVSQPALEGHVVSSVPSPAPNDLEGGVSQPAVEGHIVAVYNKTTLPPPVSSRLALLCRKSRLCSTW